tara:strand:+ start:1109 stop:1288 length:180 start_codon:yes stop_codon:yes gene_type:complete
MDNDEILKRLEKHYVFFDSLKDQIEDKTILNEVKIYMKLFFFELMKNNIKMKRKPNSKL